MEKTTDKSPVEQMREFLKSGKDIWFNKMPNPELSHDFIAGRIKSIVTVLDEFNELFPPEVQQVPIEESAIKFMQEHPLQFIMQMALRKLTKEQFKALQDWCDSYKQLPIQDIDALAEKDVAETMKIYEGRPNHKAMVRTWLAGYNAAIEKNLGAEYAKDNEKSYQDGYNAAIQSQSVQPTGSVRDIARRKYIRDQAVTIGELTKGFTGEPIDNAMKELINMSNYVLELTAYDYLLDNSAADNLPVVGWTDAQVIDMIIASKMEYHDLAKEGWEQEIIDEYKLTHSPKEV